MGIAMLVVGVWQQISRSNYVELLPSDEFFTASALLISGGIIVIVVCVFGFIGVWMESQCVLVIYTLCVFIILAIAIAAGIIAYIFHGELDDKLRSKLLEGLNDPGKKKFWDDIQQEERCCGVNNHTDWFSETNTIKSVPDSCCDGPNCGIQGASVAYNIGCYEKGKNFVKDNFYALGATGICLGILQIILVVSSVALVLILRREKMV